MRNSGHGNFGARLLENGTTEFRLWAPDVASVSLEITNGTAHIMRRDDDAVFSITLPVGAGTRYRYRISPALTVPDPASRAQVDDVDGDSIVVDPEFPWKALDWQGRPWHEAVIYELHVGALGGFTGVTQQLRRLAKLGITAVELMPIAQFPGRHSWGYDGVLNYAPDTAYGTPSELKALIDTAHGLGLMVFLDVVYNHFGPSGNYLNAYAKSFFRPDIHTPWGNAIDFRRPQVRRFYVENALYWLNDFRFDGLRFDAVSKIDDPTFFLEMAAEIKTSAAPSRYVHLVLENENNDAHLLSAIPTDKKPDAQWTDDWHHSIHVLLTGEIEGYYEDYLNPAEQLARCMAAGFCYQGEISLHSGAKPRGTKSSYLPPTAFVIFLQNHDQIGNRAMGERLSTLVRPAPMRAATLLLLMSPQIPMIFMGEEWGETKPFLFFADHSGELAESISEGRRREFATFKSFNDPEQRKKIPDPNALSTFTASIPEIPLTPSEDQTAMLAFYEMALQIRATEIMPRIPGAVSKGAHALGKTGIRAVWKMGDGAMLTIAANFNDHHLQCEPGEGTLLMSSTTAPMSGASLPANSSFVWLRKT